MVCEERATEKAVCSLQNTQALSRLASASGIFLGILWCLITMPARRLIEDGMKILDPMPVEVREEIKTGIQTHTETLRGLLTASAEMARKYLLFTNAGAAVALMAFMGNNEHVRSSPIAWAGLGLFTMGVVACGFLTALDYHVRLGAFQFWVREQARFFRGELDHEELYGSLNARARREGLGPILAGYVALACFVAGASICVWKFLVDMAASLTTEQLFTLQSNCGASARDWFAKVRLNGQAVSDEASSFGSHYNRKLNRCFAVITKANSSFLSIELLDVNENNAIGLYLQALSEKRPSRCEIEHKGCKSEAEWNALSESYVNN
jgi:hypothetical protein